MNPSTEALFNVLFPVLFIGAIVWLISIFVLIRKLQNDHLSLYRKMGEPNSHTEYTLGQLKSMLLLIRFILKREHRPLNDTNLSRLCDFMRVLFVAYLILFVSFLALAFIH